MNSSGTSKRILNNIIKNEYLNFLPWLQMSYSGDSMIQLCYACMIHMPTQTVYKNELPKQALQKSYYSVFFAGVEASTITAKCNQFLQNKQCQLWASACPVHLVAGIDTVIPLVRCFICLTSMPFCSKLIHSVITLTGT